MVMHLQNDFATDAFIIGYVEAFQALDAHKVASFYSAPCLSVRADGSVHSFANQSEIELFFASVLGTYSQEGMAKFTAADVVFEQMGSASCRLECTWSMNRDDDSVIRDWRQTYVFQLATEDWKIVASIFHL
jgi:ketosteroid isomerase-like protein